MSIKTSIFSFLQSLAYKIQALNHRRHSILASKKSLSIVSKHIQYPALTPEEKRLIQNKWSSAVDKLDKQFFLPFSLYKHFGVFDENMVVNRVYWPYICHSFNPIRYIKAFSHKAYLPLLFQGFKQPEMIAYRAGGNYYNSERELSTFSDIIDILLKQKESFFVKQAVDSLQGRGVTFVDVQSLVPPPP